MLNSVLWQILQESAICDSKRKALLLVLALQSLDADINTMLSLFFPFLSSPDVCFHLWKCFGYNPASVLRHDPLSLCDAASPGV